MKRQRFLDTLIDECEVFRALDAVAQAEVMLDMVEAGVKAALLGRQQVKNLEPLMADPKKGVRKAALRAFRRIQK